MSQDCSFVMHLNNYINEDEKVTVMPRKESDVPPHRHQFIELVYIRDGEGTHMINDQVYHVSAGDMLLINYNQIHSIKVKKPFSLVNFLFTPGFISSSLLTSENICDVFAFTLFGELSDDFQIPLPIARFRGKEYMEIESIVNTVIDEYEKKDQGYCSLIKAYMQIIFCMMMRNIRTQEAQTPNTTLHKITPEILHYIDINCFDKINLQNLAEKCFYTPSYFSRIFKESCGKSLTEYIKEKRITEAIRLVKETSMPISEIATVVGYTDRKAFYKYFKQATAYTPSEYRQKHGLHPSSEKEE